MKRLTSSACLLAFALSNCAQPIAPKASKGKQPAEEDDNSDEDMDQDKDSGDARGGAGEDKNKDGKPDGDPGDENSDPGNPPITNDSFGEAGMIPPDLKVDPVVSTETTGGDADDPAIYVHPTDASRSLIFGTDKANNSLFVFDLQGKIIQSVDFGTPPNNVDIRQGYKVGDRTLDIVVVNLRDAGKMAVMLVNADYTTAGKDALKLIADSSSTKR